ncbi:MAG TPA: molybdopterin-binding protein [Kofleriaceae bacterium]
MGALPVHIAVLTIADDAATADHSVTRSISEPAGAAGHQIVDEEIVKDNESAIRDQLVRWIAEENIDVVIVAASVESEAASAALAPLVHSTLPGFTDLFRWLTFQEIGASAMLSAAEAAQCQSTFVFVLPAHAAAVRAAMDKLILPQLDVRTKPKNLVAQMPRLKDAAKRFTEANKSAPVTTPVPEAVPQVIAVEKTSGGSGLPPKLPARSKPLTANIIARKQDDPPTKEIDLERLERQIQLSAANEAQTKQVHLKQQNDAKTKVVDMSAHQAKTRVVDSGRVLPRVPPGADETSLDDDESLTFAEPPRNNVQTARTSAPIGVRKDRTSPGTPMPTKEGTSPGTPSPMRPPSTRAFSTPIARSGSRTPPSPQDVASRSNAVAPPAAPVTPTRAPLLPLSSRSTVATPPATPIVSPRTPLSGPTRSTVATPPATPLFSRTTPTPASAPRPNASPPASAPKPNSPPASVAPATRDHVITPSTPVIALRREDTIGEQPTPHREDTNRELAKPRGDTDREPTAPGRETTARDHVITPSTPVVALRSDARKEAATPLTNPSVPRQPVDTPSTPALPPAPPPPHAFDADDEVETKANAPQPNAAELWARSIAPSPSAPAQAEPEDEEEWPNPEAFAAEAESAPPAETATTTDAADSVRTPLSNLFANQPARKRPPTAPPAHLEAMGRPVGDGALPQGDFAYPLKRSGTALLLKLLLALAVLGLGFFAFVQFYPSDDKPAQTAAVTPPAETPPPAPPTPAPAAMVVDAAAAPEPAEIEIETPAPVPAPTHPSHSTKPTTEPRPTTKPSETAEPKRSESKPSEAKPAEVKTREPASGDCDEVSCVLAKYDRPCCERYKPADGFTPKNVVPDAIDRAMVKAGVEKIKPKVVSCGEQYGAKGTVKLAVTVDGEGTVKSVSVTESPDSALGECVAGAMRHAKFGKSVNGGDFNYPFVF